MKLTLTATTVERSAFNSRRHAVFSQWVAKWHGIPCRVFNRVLWFMVGSVIIDHCCLDFKAMIWCFRWPWGCSSATQPATHPFPFGYSFGSFRNDGCDRVSDHSRSMLGIGEDFVAGAVFVNLHVQISWQQHFGYPCADCTQQRTFACQYHQRCHWNEHLCKIWFCTLLSETPFHPAWASINLAYQPSSAVQSSATCSFTRYQRM